MIACGFGFQPRLAWEFASRIFQLSIHGDALAATFAAMRSKSAWVCNRLGWAAFTGPGLAGAGAGPAVVPLDPAAADADGLPPHADSPKTARLCKKMRRDVLSVAKLESSNAGFITLMAFLNGGLRILWETASAKSVDTNTDTIPGMQGGEPGSFKLSQALLSRDRFPATECFCRWC